MARMILWLRRRGITADFIIKSIDEPAPALRSSRPIDLPFAAPCAIMTGRLHSLQVMWTDLSVRKLLRIKSADIIQIECDIWFRYVDKTDLYSDRIQPRTTSQRQRSVYLFYLFSINAPVPSLALLWQRCKQNVIGHGSAARNIKQELKQWLFAG